MTTFFVLCLLIQPWIFNPAPGVQNQFRIPQGMFLIFIFMGMIILALRKGLTNTYHNKYLSNFICYLFLSCFFYIFFNIARVQPAPLYMLVPFIYISLGIMTILSILSIFEKDDYIRIAKALCISSVLISVFSLLQYFGFDPLKATFPGLWEQHVQYRCDNRMSACLDNPNLIGMYLGLTIPMFLYFKRPLYWAGLAISLFTIYLSKSHFAWFCSIFSLLVWAFLKFREYKWVRLGLLVSSFATILILIYTGLLHNLMKLSTLMSGRADLWLKTVELFKNNPLFGLGIGFFSTLHIVTQNEVGRSIWYEVHNDWLQYLVEIGILGVFLFVLLIINSIRNYSYKEEIGNCFFTMFLTFLLFMLGSFPMEVPTIALLGLTGWCAIEKL